MTARILLVEDDALLCDMVQLILSQEGYELQIVPDGLSALELVKTWKPDLILLDVMMPHLDGIQTLQRFRELDQTMTVPILLVTARGAISDKVEGFQAGADDYIVKPFDNIELKLRIAAHLRRVELSSIQDRYTPDYTVRLPIVLSKHRSGMFQRGYRITKRIFDLLVCLIAAPFLIPILALIALAIWIDSPGAPVVFVQKRAGLNGRPFNMYKFRTMVPNAEELKLTYAHLNELTWPDFKITNDPRVTRVGRFLRRTSLDELPQLWNVLIGQMSLVGPRPTSFGADTYQLWQTERLEVLPGLTGLWQIAGRGEIDFVERVELDIEYIERQSWQLDMLILFQTVAAVISGRGAH